MNEASENIVSQLQFWRQKQLPVILQAEAAECGLACLTMVASYYGYKSDLVSMRSRFNLSIRGATLYDLMQFAESMELTSRPLRIELDDLEKIDTPCILHWDLNHFVVLKAVRAGQLILHDPAYGKKVISIDEASKHFTGVALELTPTNKFRPAEPKTRLKITDFWSRVEGLKRSLFLIFALSCLLQVFVLAGPYYVQLVIDDVILSRDMSLLVVLAIGFLLILLFEVATSALRGVSLLHFGNLLNVQLGANLFHHLVRLPLSYFEKRHMGDVVSRFGSLGQIRTLLSSTIIETIIDGLMALVTLAMIMLYNITLALVVLSAVALYALLRALTFRSLRAVSEQEIVARAEESSNFMETVRGIQTIKLFGAETDREGIWQNRFVKATNHSIRLGNFNVSFAAANRILFGAENIFVVYLAATFVMQGSFSTGMLFAFMAYKQQFMSRAASLIEKAIEFKMLGLHLDRLADIVLTEKETLHSTIASKREIKGAITIEDLSFSYSDGAPPVIQNLNLQIDPGEAVAITGASGCGKSTLIKLMLGLEQADQGSVLIDSLPIEQIGHSAYRRQVATVMQTDQLFSGTIADNIAFFEPGYDLEKVKGCARLASIHEDICCMPMAYESLVGDMGASLSGGQKQRIILARALFRQPRILFMDEATSHLDTQLEAAISAAIRELKITRVIVAHRAETIASADREIPLEPYTKAKVLDRSDHQMEYC